MCWDTKQVSIKFKKTEIISSIFPNLNDIELEINHKKNHGKITNTGNLNNVLLNNHWVNEEIKEDIKKYMEIIKNGNSTY